MKLVSLKNTSEEAQAQSPEAVEMEGPVYPYGTAIHFDNETLEKLGLDMESFKVGQTLNIQGLMKVTGTSSYEREGEDPRSCVDFQITDLALAVKGDKKSIYDSLYAKGEED